MPPKKRKKKAKTVPLASFQKLQKQFEDYQKESGEFIIRLREENKEAEKKNRAVICDLIKMKNDMEQDYFTARAEKGIVSMSLETIIGQRDEIKHLEMELKARGE